MNKKEAFSLVEVTLAIAIVAFGLIAVGGLTVVGINSSKTVADETKTNQVVMDVYNRVQAALATPSLFNAPPYPAYPAWLPANPPASSGTYFATYWYDTDGRYLDQSTDPNYATSINNVLYCAAAYVGPLNPGNSPPNTVSSPQAPGNYPVVSGSNTVQYVQNQFLQSVRIDVFWPVNSAGQVINSGTYSANRTECFYLRKP